MKDAVRSLRDFLREIVAEQQIDAVSAGRGAGLLRTELKPRQSYGRW